MLERLFFCWRNKHRDTSFTSYRLPGGNLRVERCLNCRHLIDVNMLFDASIVGMEMKLETKLSTVPGYPVDPFLRGERFR